MADIHILAIGRIGSGAEYSLTEDYLEKARKSGRQLGISSIKLTELSESKFSNSQDAKRDEADKLLNKMKPLTSPFIIACDERGQSLTSIELSQKINTTLDRGTKHIVLIIGSHAGLDESITQKANLTLALGALTWPHKLARVLIAEQLYRTTTILTGHPYHRT